MSDRFENQFKHHYELLFGGKKGFTDYYDKMRRRVKFIDKYNASLLAAACFYNEKMGSSEDPKKSKEILELAIDYLAQKNDKIVIQKHKRELMMDILRYYKVLTRKIKEQE